MNSKINFLELKVPKLAKNVSPNWKHFILIHLIFLHFFLYFEWMVSFELVWPIHQSTNWAKNKGSGAVNSPLTMSFPKACVCNRIPWIFPTSAYVIQWNECFIGLMELTRMRHSSLSLENSKVYRNEKGQFNLIWPQDDTHMRIQQDMQKRLCGIAAIIHTCDQGGKIAGRCIRWRMGILNLRPLIALMINLISN